ncbi:GntR family transcriptional regulator [Vibrio sp. EJY3]|uniref:GntR family transcriptional regulator n=1 Tax=Vibrio sp. (strain EJY3) TaxID=1116375 RepID=UPI000243B9EE|nr:GntR family transcriptional regulator [Vibrio sp. EJY3]AEX24975.1 transcriptional regulator of succinyl CoA synthetase operon [Vibrio sp. EJY3]
MKPKYIEIAEYLEQQIKEGVLEPKSMLPKESVLQEQFSVSRVTIRKSLKILVDNGLISRSRGSGTYINDPKAQHDALHLLGFIEEVSRQGKSPSSQVVKFELKKPSPRIAEKLGVDLRDDTYEIHRLRCINDEPEIYEITHMPADLFPDLSVAIMSGSKYEYIEKEKGLTITKSRQSVKPYILDETLAKQLNEKAESAILQVESTGYLSCGRPFEYTVNFFRLHQYSFDFTSTRSS